MASWPWSAPTGKRDKWGGGVRLSVGTYQEKAWNHTVWGNTGVQIPGRFHHFVFYSCPSLPSPSAAAKDGASPLHTFFPLALHSHRKRFSMGAPLHRCGQSTAIPKLNMREPPLKDILVCLKIFENRQELCCSFSWLPFKPTRKTSICLSPLEKYKKNPVVIGSL